MVKFATEVVHWLIIVAILTGLAVFMLFYSSTQSTFHSPSPREIGQLNNNQNEESK